MALAKVTFPDGTSFSNQSPEDVVDPQETGLADGGHDPGLIVLITKLLDEWNARILAMGGLGPSIGYAFDDDTVEADPGNGMLRIGGAADTATEIYVDLLDLNGADVTTLLDALGDGTSTAKGFLALRQVDDNTKLAIYRLTGVTAAAGYRKLTVVPLLASAANPFALGAVLQLTFAQTGDKGEPGNDGDVVGPGESTDNAWPRFDGAGGGTLQNGAWTEDDAGAVTAGGPLDMDGNPLTVGASLFVGGDQWKVLPLGTVTTTQTVGPSTAPLTSVTLGAAVNLDHAAPTAGYVYWKPWTVAQDGTGGRVPLFRASDGTAAVWPNDDEPDWGSQAGATVTEVVAKVTGASTVKMYLGG